MNSHLTLRREAFGQVLDHLPALYVAVLGRMLVRASPGTGCFWSTSARLAEDCKLSTALLEHALAGLEHAGALTVRRDRRDMLCVEFGALLVRETPVPENLPVEPPAV